MQRCTRRSALRHARAGVMLALTLGTVAAAQAQLVVQRSFPADALRGVITLTSASEATLNGKAVGLAPGLRIRGTNNMLVLSGEMLAQKFTANYTVDFLGQLKDIWVLREDEIARWWPRSAAEAATRVFDPVAQTWNQP